MNLGLPQLPELPLNRADLRGTFFPELSSWLSPKWIDPALISEEAKKADDAAVPEHLWNMQVCEPLGVDPFALKSRRALQVLQAFLLDQ